MKCPNPDCGEDIEYHRWTCTVCGTFVGFPNVRKAAGMSAELSAHYADAISSGRARGVSTQLRRLESLLAASCATINVKPKDLDVMSLPMPYLGYHKSIDAGLRRIAEEEFHSHRKAVDAKMCAGYESEIVCAAVSPNGHGLVNYGPIALRLRAVAMNERASVLRENSFNFYEAFDLGSRGAIEEPGWRSTWADRPMLGVAHLAPKVTPTTATGDLEGIVLHNGATRNDDRYMEIQVFGAITTQAVESVLLESPLTDARDRHTWDTARERLINLGIKVTP